MNLSLISLELCNNHNKTYKFVKNFTFLNLSLIKKFHRFISVIKKKKQIIVTSLQICDVRDYSLYIRKS